MRETVAVVVEVAGLGSIVAGCALIAPWLAFIVGGILAVVFALALTMAPRNGS